MQESKKVLITGASSGFGKRTAEILASSGYKVFATMRGTPGKNRDVKRDMESQASDENWDLEVIELDVTDQGSMDGALELVQKKGGIDVLVNNAGLFCEGVNEAFTVEQIRDVFEVNFFGVARMNRTFLPSMRKRGKGLIIYISSGSGRITSPFMGVYSASKFALEALADSYSLELEPFGIDSVILEPSAYPTEIFSKIISPKDEATLKDYGSLAKAQEKWMASRKSTLQGHDAPDPDDVPLTVKQVIEMEQGRRPLRIRVSSSKKSGIDRLNELYDELQKGKREKLRSML